MVELELKWTHISLRLAFSPKQPDKSLIHLTPISVVTISWIPVSGTRRPSLKPTNSFQYVFASSLALLFPPHFPYFKELYFVSFAVIKLPGPLLKLLWLLHRLKGHTNLTFATKWLIGNVKNCFFSDFCLKQISFFKTFPLFLFTFYPIWLSLNFDKVNSKHWDWGFRPLLE